MFESMVSNACRDDSGMSGAGKNLYTVAEDYLQKQ